MGKKKLILLVAIMLSLVACNSSTDKKYPEEIKGQLDSVEDGEPQVLNIAYMPNYGSLWAIENAINLKFFEEEGLVVNLHKFSDGYTIITSMESGIIDIGYIGQGAHKYCINGKADVILLSHLSNADVVIGGPFVNEISDLKGKKIAYTPNTSGQMILMNALKSQGYTLDDIIGVELDEEGIVQAMRQNTVDAAAIWSPGSNIILNEVEGTKKLADNSSFAENSISLASWIAVPEYAEENKEIVVKFIRAILKAMDYSAKEHFEETAKLVSSRVQLEEEEVLLQTADAEWLTGKEVIEGIKDGTVAKFYELQKQMFIETGEVEGNPKVEDYILFDYILEAGKY